MSGLLAPLVGKGQMQWNEAVQTRIDVTARTLGQMKELKLLGLTDKLTTLIQKLRAAEIQISTKYRIKLMTILSICNAISSCHQLTYTVSVV